MRESKKTERHQREDRATDAAHESRGDQRHSSPSAQKLHHRKKKGRKDTSPNRKDAKMGNGKEKGKEKKKGKEKESMKGKDKKKVEEEPKTGREEERTADKEREEEEDTRGMRAELAERYFRVYQGASGRKAEDNLRKAALLGHHDALIALGDLEAERGEERLALEHYRATYEDPVSLERRAHICATSKDPSIRNEQKARLYLEAAALAAERERRQCLA